MKQLTSLNGDANQILNAVLDGGNIVQLTFRYCSNQQAWFYSVAYGSFASNNRRLVVSPNMLRSFREIIPFGLACVSVDGYEPGYQNDFSSGRISLYVLNQSDIVKAEELISITIPVATGDLIV